ncbi:glycoside hydrolase family 16 protein [Streptomyces sp. NPDC001393]
MRSDGIVQDGLTPSGTQPGTAVAATVRLHAATCITVKKVGVAVEDGLGEHLDYPGVAEIARICPDGFAFTTRPRAFRAGTCTQYAYYVDETGNHPLRKTKLRVIAPSQNADPAAGKRLAWAEDFTAPFTWGDRWTRDTSSAYEYGTHNPRYSKLDWVNPENVRIAEGTATFTARPGPHTLENGRRAWETGPITTEGSREGFRLQPGDYLETRVKLPSAVGAWPAVWTWVDGGQEIDVFEYHPDARTSWRWRTMSGRPPITTSSVLRAAGTGRVWGCGWAAIPSTGTSTASLSTRTGAESARAGRPT